MLQKAVTLESIIEYRETKEANEIKQSSIDNRVRKLHSDLCERLKDDNYELGHTYKIAKFSDFEIYKLADWCARKANTPGKAFVSIFEKKLRSL